MNSRVVQEINDTSERTGACYELLNNCLVVMNNQRDLVSRQGQSTPARSCMRGRVQDSQPPSPKGTADSPQWALNTQWKSELTQDMPPFSRPFGGCYELK